MVSDSRSNPAPVVSFDDEPLICVDEHDRELGHASKAACHDGDGVLHRALSVFLFNAQGEVLLQQRSEQKRLWPLWWANSCCSHPRRGEAIEAAAQRRTLEELGVRCNLLWTHRFIYHAGFGAAGSEHELCHVFIGRTDQAPVVNPHEIAATRWLTPAALDEAVADQSQLCSPWLRLEWRALREQYWAQVEAVVAGQVL